MHDRGKSDDPVVPAKRPNNAQGGAAEAVEGSGSAKGNTASETRSGPSAGPNALSDLDRVRRVVKVVGFVASAPGFFGQPGVINGASELLGQVFGDAGRHARSAVGVAVLPLDAPVEVEVVVEVE